MVHLMYVGFIHKILNKLLYAITKIDKIINMGYSNPSRIIFFFGKNTPISYVIKEKYFWNYPFVFRDWKNK